ncbi:hypothetical protein PR048_030084 [Dryococelus australis]|uniref:Uncharacterized protein n=1 Tax=Dryococelus australis TaxID=614101 RepID=A0ABQ9GBU7_9NEOP|nr:hypothetical protein PR048_030084 [Dryococelus australis]
MEKKVLPILPCHLAKNSKQQKHAPNTNTDYVNDTTFILEKNKPAHIPPQKDKKRTHNFLLKLFFKYPWLHYNEKLKDVVCFECTEVMRKKLLSRQTKAESRFISHEKSQAHKEAVVKINSLHLEYVISQIGMQSDVAKALETLFKSLYLDWQGLAFRDHDDNSGNFMQLLKMMSQYIPELSNFFNKKKSYTSPVIQNEFNKTAAHFVLREIVSDIQTSGYYSIIYEETDDISRHELVSISILTVLRNMSVKEHFLGLYETASLTGETIFELCYDDGRNMSGINKGVQKRMLDLQPLATYNPGSNYSIYVRAIPLIQDCMQWVNDVDVLTLKSPKNCQKNGTTLPPSNQTTLRDGFHRELHKGYKEKYSNIYID